MKQKMATGYLITSLTGALKRINEVLNDHVLKTLYIQVYSKKFQSDVCISNWVSNKIVDVYSCTSNLYPNLDVKIILNELKRGGIKQDRKLFGNIKSDIDVIILPKSYKSDEITRLIMNNKKNVCVVLLEESDESEDIGKNDSHLKVYENVVLGGTFDRLHAGHKILITQALLQCSKSVTVGVTDTSMVKSKILWELIEPCEKRIEIVKKFIEEVDDTVECDVVPISDMYGPTKSDPKFNMIVVSAETEKGASKINEIRKQNGLNTLDVCSIRIVEEDCENDGEELKISSSNIRKRLLGMRIQDPQLKPGLPHRPYIIGLTGGICSGKSSIGEYLKTLGAGLIDCDKVAHELYKSGTPVFNDVVNTFGREIINDDGEIDRKKLGNIVFSDSKKLDQLNQLLWPKIMEQSLKKCMNLYKEEKKDVIILEAAVLLQAGWHKNVHEVWTAIIPREEAVSRLMNRNKLTENEANLRLDMQPTNSQQIAIANVVFCSLWSYGYTRKQVQRAWNMLNETLNLPK